MELATLDLAPLFRARAEAGEKLFFEVDGHPNTRGYALIAEGIRSYLLANAERYGPFAEVNQSISQQGPLWTWREVGSDQRIMPRQRIPLTAAVFMVFTILVLTNPGAPTEAPVQDFSLPQEPQPLRKRIDFISTKRSQRTPSPPGWEPYDGAVYTPERGYGWLIDLAGCCGDKRGVGEMILPDGTEGLARALGEIRLAHWQGTTKKINRSSFVLISPTDGTGSPAPPLVTMKCPPTTCGSTEYQVSSP